MDSKFLVELSGRTYPLYAGVLAEAHSIGLEAIDTELVQLPTKENGEVAVVRATVRLTGGKAFTDYGDASPRNCPSRIATALIRMASTRAKGRALRDACNIGETLLEELPEEQPARPQTAPGPVRYAPGTMPERRPTAGFEEVYDTGTKTYRRADMVRQCLQYQEQAREEGIKFEAIDPTKTPNAELFAFARELRPKLTVKAAMKEGVQGAAETVAEVTA